ncbi:MAG TPA: hypothetical protein VGN55_01450 [Xanthobacteraceae bacterium]
MRGLVPRISRGRAQLGRLLIDRKARIRRADIRIVEPRVWKKRPTGVRSAPTIVGAMEAAMSVPYETQRPVVSDNALAVIVYLLYCLGYFTGISALIGVIIAHVKVDDSDPVLRSHYRFQIRTFWIGLLYLAIGIPLCVLLIGFPILGWWFIWSLVRIVKGILLVTEHRPIANPTSWLFG